MSEQSKRLLLVEDDASMRKFIEIILSKAGFEVIVAEDGLIALKLYGEAEVDAVVADAIMPNLSGYELCRMIRARFPDRIVPFIILSGLDERADDNRFCDAFLTKDTNLKERLLETIGELIG